MNRNQTTESPSFSAPENRHVQPPHTSPMPRNHAKMNRTLSGHCWTTSGGRNFYNGFLVLSGQLCFGVRCGRTARNFHVAEKRAWKMSMWEKCSSKVDNESFSVSQSSAGNPAGRRVHHVDQSVRLVRLFVMVFI